MAAKDPTANRMFALPAPLRRTVQVSCYGDLAPSYGRANLPVLKACLQAPGLWSEASMLERLLYKNQHQHRGAHYVRHLKEVRRLLSQLRELQLAALVDDLHYLAQMGGATSVGPKADGRAAGKAALGGALGGRASYRLPSRGAAAAVMKQLIAGTALIRGLQPAVLRATGHLAGQMAMTYFVPLTTVAMAMLARIKVLSLQLLLDCVKAYNTIADLLPLLPASGSVEVSLTGSAVGGDPTLLLPPELAATLQAPPNPPLPAASDTAGAITAGRPGVAGAQALEKQQQQQQPQQEQQQQLVPEPRSRSLRELLRRPPVPAIPPPTAQGNAAGPAAPAAGTEARPMAACTDGDSSPAPAVRVLPYMVRCRWDEVVQEPYVEEVPPGPGDPTWQQRAAKVAEQYGYMVAVQLDDFDAGAAATAAAALPGREAQQKPGITQGGKRRKGEQPAGATGIPAVAAPAAAPVGSADVGIRVERRSFFDMMASKRPPVAAGTTAPGAGSTQAPAAAALGGGAKRTHAAQAMAPLQVFEDRGAKRLKAPGSGAAIPSAAAADSTALDAAAAAPTPAAGLRAAPPVSAAAVAGGAQVPSASPVVLSYTTRGGFMLGGGPRRAVPSSATNAAAPPGGTGPALDGDGTAPAAPAAATPAALKAGKQGDGGDAPVAVATTAASAEAPVTAGLPEGVAERLLESVRMGNHQEGAAARLGDGVASADAGSLEPGTADERPAAMPAAAAPPAASTIATLTATARNAAKPAFIAVPRAAAPAAARPIAPSNAAATTDAGSIGGGVGGGGAQGLPAQAPPSSKAAAVKPATAAPAAGADSGAVADPLLGIILGGGRGKARARGAGPTLGSQEGRGGSAPAAAKGGPGPGAGSLAASLELLLGGAMGTLEDIGSSMTGRGRAAAGRGRGLGGGAGGRGAQVGRRRGGC